MCQYVEDGPLHLTVHTLLKKPYIIYAQTTQTSLSTCPARLIAIISIRAMIAESAA